MSSIASTVHLVLVDKVTRLERELKECKAENRKLKRQLTKLQPQGEK
jgi:cell division protein FtsB